MSLALRNTGQQDLHNKKHSEDQLASLYMPDLTPEAAFHQWCPGTAPSRVD